MSRIVTWMMFVLSLLAVHVAAADERILSFDSDITVERDGSMRVTETIRVRAEGKDIKRGIYRDFPTDYRDRAGNRYRVGFELLGVRRDGAAEDYHTERLGNGVRVYIGNANRYLARGEYTYTVSYRTDRQLGFFDHHDELYWNVTGNGWSFPIDHASATVTLPSGIPADRIELEAYTGPTGSRGADYTARVDDLGRARFELTRPLGPEEGLTIVVSWPKGYVTQPTLAETMAYTARDNRDLIAGLIGLAILLGYYLVVWRSVGRDPRAGVIIPMYFPPDGYSPASLRFIRRMGYDNQGFAVAIVNLAVKGALRISENDRVFTLQKLKDVVDLAPGEAAIMSKLFAGRESITLKQTHHRVISSAIKAQTASLQNDYEKKYFVANSGWVIPGVAITVLSLVASAVMSPHPEGGVASVFMLVWLAIWSIGVFVLAKQVISAWRNATSALSVVGAVMITGFALPFFGGELFGLFALGALTSIPVAVVFIVAAGANYLFYELLKAPTLAGRRLLDKVEGFRLYLDVAEKDELNLRNPPQRTPELFERYLPFALALDVEQRWAEKFAAVLERAGQRPESYQPGWYSGRSLARGGLQGFTASLGGALSNAVSSSSTAPGSSSGGGGGGSSGGGGGGGGGGGW
jgi:uncharacterized membrane protein YgcG